MCDLTQEIFTDADKAREHLEAIRWPNGPICPHCGTVDKQHAKLNGKGVRPGLFYCNHCEKQFTVTVGTVFERSKVPLNKWVLAFHLVCSSKKGVSSHQIHRSLGVTYKTAWFMTHRIREAMKPNGGGLLGSSGGTVEADETYVMKTENRRKPNEKRVENAVFSLVERNGNVRSFHVPDVTADTLKRKLYNNVSTKAKMMTDGANAYHSLGKYYASHESVNHSAGEYVRGNAHTNTVEGFFSIFKRGLYGVFQHVSSQHLERYTTEFDFRYNHRTALGFNDAERAVIALRGIGGKRLTYRRTSQHQEA